MLAFVNRPSPNLQAGERTFVDPDQIDYVTALKQHAAYCDQLRAFGVTVRPLFAIAPYSRRKETTTRPPTGP